MANVAVAVVAGAAGAIAGKVMANGKGGKGDDEADSRVDLANLTDGNPFKLEEEAVQPGRPMIDNKIQPVGLTQEEDDPLAILAQSDSESDEQGLKPFNRNTELKSTPGDGDGPDFAAFGDDGPLGRTLLKWSECVCQPLSRIRNPAVCRNQRLAFRSARTQIGTFGDGTS